MARVTRPAHPALSENHMDIALRGGTVRYRYGEVQYSVVRGEKRTVRGENVKEFGASGTSGRRLPGGGVSVSMRGVWDLQ